LGSRATHHESNEIFTGKVRRREEENLRFALPQAGLDLRCAPNGAASNQTF
jgi:hypothetical protein